ncbi:WD40-repeat-containing domain protein [Cokeromyces recurvatus]|uniref:WD40-repeat-containing domain protein n=1 Tax=Cokeromyces recurvatus TaxID=90255 RepID=UPI00221F16C4|nr:WD40-repeat-containing domain protein [Cokeromyces recurvatus]KAI7906667.1 WD40-repeat-containing domain protein [Cokeromyces recurvatus]
MSTDEEDLELNDDTTSQIETITDDGGDTLDTEDLPSPIQTTAPLAENNTRLQPDPQMLTCSSYDCVPIVAAVHPTPISSLATTHCYRWVFTGSEDGYIRKWDFFSSMNGKTSLTQAQRHYFVDSVVYAGVLSSWWENEEVPETNSNESSLPPIKPFDIKLSPVFSLAVQSEALWALSGCENGAINLSTVRHEEGKVHHVLRKHKGPVSVLEIMPNEQSAISGSWDTSVLEWDLHTGHLVRSYSGHNSQISSASCHPNDEHGLLTTSMDGQCLLWDRRESNFKRLPLPERTPPWCLSACWSVDGKKIYVGRRNGTVDEYDFREQKWIQSFRMPANSGPVSFVKSMANGKHIICASNDNIRLWNTTIESNFTIRPDSEPGFTANNKKLSSVIPFSILPGHHGGTISHISIDPTCKYMITTSGNRGWEGNSTNGCLFYDISPLTNS